MSKKHAEVSGTSLIHGDATSGHPELEVAPSISVTTTFRAPPYSPEISEDTINYRDPSRHVYARYTQNVNTRAEHILSKVNNGYALTYASGLAAAYAALVFYQPKRIAISGGYHGCHASIEVYNRSKGGNIKTIGLDDEYQAGDLCWLETPLNPTGISRDIKYYADKIRAVGGKMVIDSTFGPPPLQYPFKWGADLILHSGSKYFGGHSDLLCGILVAKTEEEWTRLFNDRTFMGSMMGSLEAWLLLRSLKTFHLRVPRHSQNATVLAKWLDQVAKTPPGKNFEGIPGGIVSHVWHSSLQGKDSRGFEPSVQMEGGWNACFSILLTNDDFATRLPHSLKYFVAATSLGGVESLIEHRIMSDSSENPRLVRLSIGVEDVEDLKDDLRNALRGLSVKAKL